MPESDQQFKMKLKSDELSRIKTVEPTPEVVDKVRELCAQQAETIAECRMFLEMLGIAP
jgi:hypothetical protein